jgi:hypothetical protein
MGSSLGWSIGATISSQSQEANTGITGSSDSGSQEASQNRATTSSQSHAGNITGSSGSGQTEEQNAEAMLTATTEGQENTLPPQYRRSVLV